MEFKMNVLEIEDGLFLYSSSPSLEYFKALHTIFCHSPIHLHSDGVSCIIVTAVLP